MLLSLYEPEGKLESMIVTVDKNDFVIAVRKEGEVVVAKEEDMVVPAIETRICHGPWHNKSGKGTELPITEFEVASRGPNSGRVGSTCTSCRKRHSEYNKKSAARKQITTAVYLPQVIPPLPPIANGSIKEVPVAEPAKYKWIVTIVKEVEILVEANDYLDAGVNAGDGEVISVRRV